MRPEIDFRIIMDTVLHYLNHTLVEARVANNVIGFDLGDIDHMKVGYFAH